VLVAALQWDLNIAGRWSVCKMHWCALRLEVRLGAGHFAWPRRYWQPPPPLLSAEQAA
jgi:hypothetical protein